MNDDTGPVLHEAIALHRKGHLGDAEARYRQILSREPRHVDALRLLGLLAQQTGRVELAVESIAKAVSINRHAAQGHLELARAYRAAGHVDQAVNACRNALRIKPMLTAAWLELAGIHCEMNELGAALEWCGRAVRCDAASDEAWHTQAKVLRMLGRGEEAVASYRRAIELAPANVRLRNNYGTLLQELGRIDEAIDVHRACLDIAPDDCTSLSHLARAYQKSGRFDEAIATSRRACHSAQDNDGRRRAAVVLASVLTDVGRWDEAASLLECAVVGTHDQHDVLYQLGCAYQAGGSWQRALLCFDTALKLAPDDANAHLDRALLNIQCGRLAEGWDEYEWRWRAKRRRPRAMGIPRWDGQPLDGRTVLVHGEQGVGDEIMFATCLPDLVDRGGRVILTCNPRLQPLFQRSFPMAEVQGVGEHGDDWRTLAAAADAELPAGSLPRYFRRGWDSFPNRRRLLVPDPVQRAEWNARYAALGPGLKIGVSWRAGTSPVDRRLRSIELRQWIELLGMPNTHWISVQYGDVREEIAELASNGVTLCHWPDSDPLHDLDAFAAQIDALDLVISVGNATAHLAGALARPVWVLLPEHWGWRWFTEREDSPWYPTARLFRQRDGLGWPEVLRRVQHALGLRITGLTEDRSAKSADAAV